MNPEDAASAAGLLCDAKAIAADLKAIRRRIHRHPELGFEESRTAATITDRLSALGIDAMRTVAGTGIVALVEGRGPGPVIGLRADMDALPIQETTGADYTSQVPGVMHACGHDAHVACLLGAADLLVRRRQRFEGAVKLIFQPAEEIDQGATAIIAAGGLEDPAVAAVFGLHVDPEVPVGRILVRKGTWMGAIDTFRIRITGRGGHGAYPHKCADAIVAGAGIVMNLQAVVSRRTDPALPLVVTVGTFTAGQAENIVAGAAELTGTVRCIDPHIHAATPGHLAAVVEHTAAALGVEASLDYRRVIPPLINDPAMTAVLIQAARDVLGERAVLEDAQRMGGDDFGCYLTTVPGAYCHLGAGDGSADASRALHTGGFDIDEGCLPLGAALLARTALSLLPPGGRPDRWDEGTVHR